jgi:hypothetical protein
MATQDHNVLLFRQQPALSQPHQSLADQMDEVLTVINAVEQVPILSQDILDRALDGDPYETLVRKIGSLHDNLVEMSKAATRAKTIQL